MLFLMSVKTYAKHEVISRTQGFLSITHSAVCLIASWSNHAMHFTLFCIENNRLVFKMAHYSDEARNYLQMTCFSLCRCTAQNFDFVQCVEPINDWELKLIDIVSLKPIPIFNLVFFYFVIFLKR